MFDSSTGTATEAQPALTTTKPADWPTTVVAGEVFVDYISNLWQFCGFSPANGYYADARPSNLSSFSATTQGSIWVSGSQLHIQLDPGNVAPRYFGTSAGATCTTIN
jgi:hypothetical protein